MVNSLKTGSKIKSDELAEASEVIDSTTNRGDNISQQMPESLSHLIGLPQFAERQLTVKGYQRNKDMNLNYFTLFGFVLSGNEHAQKKRSV
ncbi:hypothetical protein NPIL_551711 [Nephila pilipes]|uniref:Uncharacterized protein n=1 Tax=Nephila pilipes TaxID=299642 RepID=A0A8X6TRG2_NEPPI|nr:hypothetical protein NPIL_551711 [Nephila pilipes]